MRSSMTWFECTVLIIVEAWVGRIDNSVEVECIQCQPSDNSVDVKSRSDNPITTKSCNLSLPHHACTPSIKLPHALRARN